MNNKMINGMGLIAIQMFLLHRHQVHFPDSDSRTEFLDDCIDCVLDKFGLYEHYAPEYTGEVLDLARLYGYLL